MYFHMTIHTPKADKADALIDSMHRFGEALKNAPGLVSVHTLRDENTGKLVGLAIWESKEAMMASLHLAREAVANDPFDEWEEGDVQGFRLLDV